MSRSALEVDLLECLRAVGLRPLDAKRLAHRGAHKTLPVMSGIYLVHHVPRNRRGLGEISQSSVSFTETVYAGEARNISDRVRLLQNAMRPDAKHRAHPVGWKNFKVLPADRRLECRDLVVTAWTAPECFDASVRRILEARVLLAYEERFGSAPLFNAMNSRRKKPDRNAIHAHEGTGLS